MDKSPEDKEFQRKVVLGADAIVSTVWRGIRRVIMIGLGIFFLLLVVGIALEPQTDKKLQESATPTPTAVLIHSPTAIPKNR